MPTHAAGIVASGKKVSGPKGTASNRAVDKSTSGRKTDSAKMAGSQGTKNPERQGT